MGNSYEHNYKDSDSDSNHLYSYDASKRRVAEAALVDESKMQYGNKSVAEHDSDEDFNVRIFPAMLRTNRQTCSAASSLLLQSSTSICSLVTFSTT